MIDLRSDTVTLPPMEMREAIYRADIGDDCYGEDPTVNRLEEYAAELLGKESGLYVTSGTQGNLVSQLSHTQPGDELILGHQDAGIGPFDLGYGLHQGFFETSPQVMR